MRLTLRTMLAYLDDVLSPQDAAVLGDKIKQSDYATKLSRHIRASVRENSVGAPALSGKGSIDANAVAEYLDSTLPADQIEGYETLCLPPSEEIERTANEHMAETAACHQILTLVLGQSAECSSNLRNRIYRLDTQPEGHPDRPESSSTNLAPLPAQNGEQDEAQRKPLLTGATGDALAAPAGTDATQPATPASKQSKRDIPEYLRNNRQIRILPLAIILLLGFLLTFATLRALGPFSPQHPLLGHLWTDTPAEDQIAAANVAETAPPTAQPVAGSQTGQPDALDTDALPKEAGSNDREPSGTNAGPQAANAGDEDAAQANGNTNPLVPAVSIPEPAADTSTPEPATTPAPVNAGEGLAAPTAPPQAAADTPDASAGETPAPQPSLPSPPETDTAPGETTPANDAPAAADHANRVDVGRFISVDQILVRKQQDTDAWYRVKQFTTLKSDDQLKVLPGFRPQIVMASGVQLTFVGASDITLHTSGPDATPKLAAEYTRLLASTNGMAGQSLQVTTANAQGTLTFAETDTVIALESKRFLPPGSDPIADPGKQVTQIIVTGGKLVWLPTGANAKPLEVKAGQVWAAVGEQSGRILDVSELPAWTAADNDLASTDSYAAPELESVIGPERPLSLTLMEQVTHRQRDVRSLVARCLSYLDVHEPIVTQLNDNDQRRYWFASIDVLQDSISRSPDSAVKLQEAFEKKRGDVAPDLFRLCWGYSQQQLEEGAAAELVTFLESEEMDIRVLTLATLKRITGRTELYSPEREPKQERSEIQNWKKNLEKGAIQYQILPTALPYTSLPAVQ